MQKLITRIIVQISFKNFKLFYLYTKEYGIKFTLHLLVSFLAEKEIIPDFIYNYFQNTSYRKWILTNEPTIDELLKQKEACKLFNMQPKFSVIVATYNTAEIMLKQMIESVMDQTYSNWELCIADGSFSGNGIEDILNEYSRLDSRIRKTRLPSNYGIAGNSNKALGMASGEYVVLMDHDDTIAPFALFEAAKLINNDGKLDFIYSDEDKLSNDGSKRFAPFFKPDWGPSPDTLLSYNYFGHLSIIKRSLFKKTELWFDENYEGSQDYNLYLKIIEKTNRIGHISKILYHWRSHPSSAASSGSAKPYAIISGQKAIHDFMKRQGFECSVEILDDVGRYKIENKIQGEPFVSIIIPTKDNVIVLKKCINSILQKTTYNHYEIIIVNNQSQEL